MPRPTALRGLAVVVGITIAGLGWLVWSASGDYPPGLTPPPAADAAAPTAPPAWAAPAVAGRTLVVLLFDGLAPEMIAAVDTPALDRIRREGAWTHQLAPAFPTVSLVNGFTLTTGCWPARHGIVHNRFLDPERGLYDHALGADWITGCEPLHEAAERQGVRTAAMDWFGAHSASRGWLVTMAAGMGHRPELKDSARIDWALEVLSRETAERPRLILTYLWGPDMAAHFDGLDSEAVRRAVEDVDRQVGRVMAAIEASGTPRETALVVLTDHGMRPVSHLLNLERILRRRGVDATMLGTGSVAFLYLDDRSRLDRAERALAGHPAFTVYRPADGPAWSRVGSGPRVGDLIVSSRPPYFIEDRSTWPRWVRWGALWGPEVARAERFLRASHGYPPDEAGMHGVLYAWGGGIARGVEAPGLSAVDVHPTLAEILGIEPGSPVDGRVVGELLALP